MSKTLAAILGGAAGAVALVGILVITIWYCIFRGRNVSRTSETGSSDPSVQGSFAYMWTKVHYHIHHNYLMVKTFNLAVGRAVGIELTLRDARRFGMDELSSATRNFSDKSLIGQGKFGEVYKGLLHDGMLVAIKKRPGPPTQEFVDEVSQLSMKLLLINR